MVSSWEVEPHIVSKVRPSSVYKRPPSNFLRLCGIKSRTLLHMLDVNSMFDLRMLGCGNVLLVSNSDIIELIGLCVPCLIPYPHVENYKLILLLCTRFYIFIRFSRSICVSHRIYQCYPQEIVHSIQFYIPWTTYIISCGYILRAYILWNMSCGQPCCVCVSHRIYQCYPQYIVHSI